MNVRIAAVGLFCISGGLLSYEFLLTRLLSLAYWGHFAGLVFSIAMLGLAAAGLFLHFWRERIQVRPGAFFSVSAGLFAMSAPLAFFLSQSLPFAPYLLTWSLREYFWLACRILLFFVPFFCSGVAVGVPYVGQILPASRLYFWSMLGSGVPLPFLLGGLMAVHPSKLLVAVSVLGGMAACLLAQTGRQRLLWAAASVAACGAVIVVPFRYSEYKALSRTLDLPEARVLRERTHWQGLVQTVLSPHTRYLPGLSLNYAGSLPRSELVFADGAVMDTVFDPQAALAEPAFLQQSPEAFAYVLHDTSAATVHGPEARSVGAEALRKPPRVLLLGGASLEILRALSYQSAEIVAVDELSGRADALDEIWTRYGNSPFRSSAVRRVDDEARHYLDTSRERFDLIFLSLLGSHAASTAGAASLDPSYLFTVEGISRLWDRLAPRGCAVFTTWVENPPRAGVRLGALLIDTLRRRGVAEPAAHLLALRSWSTLTFYVGSAPFDGEAAGRLKAFADENSFDLVHYPGISPKEANRFNVIPDAPYFAAVQALLGNDREEFRDRWPFRLRPSEDDAPFFNHHFRWAAVPELVKRLGKDWVPYIEWGYLLLIAALGLTTLLGALFLIGPCFAVRSRPPSSVLVFLALGFAYMFVEMWALYKVVHLVGYATLAFAVVLLCMLSASGAGAALLATGGGAIRSAVWKLSGVVVSLVVVLTLASPLAAAVRDESLPIRALCGGLWIAGPAFFMGFPFPYALEHLARPKDIPWALALNGLGSVLGSLAATLLAVHFGLTALALAAVGLYMIVAGVLLVAGQNSS